MKLDPILTKASKLARSGKYEAVLRTLEPEVNRYHGSFRYYYLLGSSCLRAGDFGGALTYFRLAHETKRRDPLAILGLGVLYLNRGETERAVNFYLEILEIDHKNRAAKKALKVIRKNAGVDAFSLWLDAGNLPSLYPPIPFPGFSPGEKLAAFGIMLAVCAAVFISLIHFKIIPNPFNIHGERQGVIESILTREERLAPLQTGGDYHHEFTSRVQAVDAYERALSLFTAYRDEAARVYINRILISNADDGLKTRARTILSFLESPNFDNFRRSDNVSYSVVEEDPVLYNGVHVIWQGRAANIESSENETAFNLLVDYDPDINPILRGTVIVRFNRAIQVIQGRQLEVLGRIISSGTEGHMYLEGISIHQPRRLDNQ